MDATIGLRLMRPSGRLVWHRVGWRVSSMARKDDGPAGETSARPASATDSANQSTLAGPLGHRPAGPTAGLEEITGDLTSCLPRLGLGRLAAFSGRRLRVSIDGAVSRETAVVGGGHQMHTQGLVVARAIERARRIGVRGRRDIADLAAGIRALAEDDRQPSHTSAARSG